MKIQHIIHSLLILVGIISLQAIVGVKTSFVSDSLVKAVQIDSIVKNGYTSQEIILPGNELDPNFLLQPLNIGFILESNGIFVGQYPIFFTYIYSLIPISLEYLPFLNAIPMVLLALILFSMVNEKKMNIPIVYYTIFGSVVLSLLFDLSEYPLYLMLSGSGFYLIYINWESQKKFYYILGYFLIGLSVWLRLESLIFAFSISAFNLYLYYTSDSLKNHFFKYFLGNLAFVLSIIGFVYFNIVLYDHFLGPRFIAAIEGSSPSLMERFVMFSTIVFSYLRDGIPSLGFFFFSPVLLYISIKIGLNYRQEKPDIQSLIGIVVLYMLLIGFTAPNDGVTVTGRYAVLAIFPLSLLFNHYIKNYKIDKLYYFLLVWNLLVIALILVVYFFTFKEIRKVNSLFHEFDADAYVASNEMISGSFGLKLLEVPVFAVRTQENLHVLDELAKKSEFQSINVFSYNRNFKSFSNPEQYSNEEIIHNKSIELLQKYNYICNDEKPKYFLNISKCNRN